MAKRTDIQKFFDKVELSDEGCWEWTASFRNTYPRFRPNGAKNSMPAHRWIYMTLVGEIPEGHFICHRCDNRSCVNPFHLKACSHQENMDDMVKRGRSQSKFLKKSERRTWLDWVLRR